MNFPQQVENYFILLQDFQTRKDHLKKKLLYVFYFYDYYYYFYPNKINIKKYI